MKLIWRIIMGVKVKNLLDGSADRLFHSHDDDVLALNVIITDIDVPFGQVLWMLLKVNLAAAVFALPIIVIIGLS